MHKLSTPELLTIIDEVRKYSWEILCPRVSYPFEWFLIEERLERDKEAFLRMEESLIEEYLDEYVAILDGEIIAHHRDAEELIKQLDEKIGPIPLFIAKVEKRPSPIRLPSPKLSY